MRLFAEKCKICVFTHDKLPCDPCQFLLRPEELSSTNFFDFFCLGETRGRFLIDRLSLEQTYKAY